MDSPHSDSDVKYLVFDIESIPDPTLVSLVRTSGQKSPSDALRECQEEIMSKKGTDFVPYNFHVPVSLALAKVAGDYSLKELTVLKIENGGPQKICERFWEGWRYYNRPQLVTFNGRSFDVPLMELIAFRYGVSIPDWFDDQKPSYQQCRNRYASYHLDLYDFLCNYGASVLVGGLNVAAKILRKSGKIGTKGDMVQELIETGRLDDVHDYCRCDVLDTYFVFLRICVLRGKISLERENELIEQTRRFLEENSDDIPVYREYLKAWKGVVDYSEANDEISRLISLSTHTYLQ